MKRILLVVMICCLLTAFCACTDLHAAQFTSTPEAAKTPDPTPSPTPVPTTKAEETPTPTLAPTRITVMAVGDLMCLGAQLSAAHSGGGYRFDYAFAGVTDIISSADLAIGNLETLIAEGHPYTAISSGNDDDDEPSSEPSESADGAEEPIGGAEEPTGASVEPSPASVEPSPGGEGPSGEDGASGGGGAEGFSGASDRVMYQPGQSAQQLPLLQGPRINGPETYLSAVVDAGFDVLTTANNHINDYGADGIQKTMSQLDAYGIPHTGAFAAEEDKVPLIVDVQGIKIGVVAYTDLLNRGGNRSLINIYDEGAMTADIAAVKEAGADFVIVSMHWGIENTHTVNNRQRRVAQHIAEAGADLILGAHPHCLQEFELIETDRGSVPVIYSLGNFISSMAGRAMNRDGVIFKFELEKDNTTGEVSLQDLSYIPTYCVSTSEGRFMLLPATESGMASNPKVSGLKSSRERTIDVLGTDIATPE